MLQKEDCNLLCTGLQKFFQNILNAIEQKIIDLVFAGLLYDDERAAVGTGGCQKPKSSGLFRHLFGTTPDLQKVFPQHVSSKIQCLPLYAFPQGFIYLRKPLLLQLLCRSPNSRFNILIACRL